MTAGGGRYDFDDGGTFCGGWEDGKAHGHGVCTGPKGQGEYSGSWAYGYESLGIYTWPSGNCYEGQWMTGKRHGVGVETKGRWIYQGEWTTGFKGRYGVRQSTSSGAKYQGTWTTGLQDGYGVENYADGGTYMGQWLIGTRHGYGVRQSVPYGLAAHYRPKALRTSLTSIRSENEDDRIVKERDRKLDESRGGFVLKAHSDDVDSPSRRKSIFDKTGRSSLKKTILSSLKLKKQRSTGDLSDSAHRGGLGLRPGRPSGSMRSTISNASHLSTGSTASSLTNHSVMTSDQESNHSFVSQDDILDANVTETYMGEWKNDKRSGFGISERTDGLKYEGEWYNNKKYGYGITYFKDGTKEEGKYKHNVLISPGKKNKLFTRAAKVRERIENAVSAARRAAQIAQQKCDIAQSRMATARSKAEEAKQSSMRAKQESDMARIKAKEFAPEFHQPGTDILKKRLNTNNGVQASQITAVLNHNPHHRSKSLMHKTPTSSPVSNRKTSLHPPMSSLTTAAVLTSAALDCAVASGSSTGLSHIKSGTMLTPAVAAPAHQLNVTDPYHQIDDTEVFANLNGAIKHSPRISPRSGLKSHGSFRGSKRRRHEGEVTPSTIISDHFDQYGKINEKRNRDTGIGNAKLRNLKDTPIVRVTNKLQTAGGARVVQNQTINDVTPDSGIDSMDIEESKKLSHVRRNSLPCIIQIGSPKLSNKKSEDKPVEHQIHLSSENLTNSPRQTFIIENGIRKRIHTETNNIHKSDIDKSSIADLPERFRIEENTSLGARGAARGSIPDVRACEQLRKDVMPRSVVSKMSEKRREELRSQREEEERRKEGDIVLRIGDIKDWCQQRQLLMLVIGLNVTLATMFFNLLAGQH